MGHAGRPCPAAVPQENEIAIIDDAKWWRNVVSTSVCDGKCPNDTLQ